MPELKALIANETGHTSNPGCRAVRRGLTRLLSLANISRQDTLPLGFWSEAFNELAPTKEHRVIRKLGKFVRANPEPAPLDFDSWKNICDRLGREDLDLIAKLDASDVLIVNGEGTIHHNLPRALGLSALIHVARNRGKRVALLNSTIQGMDEKILKQLGDDLDFCHLRESFSYGAVRPFVEKAFKSPDLAILALKVIESLELPYNLKRKDECMITGGVLVDERMIRHIVGVVRQHSLNPWYLLIGDGDEKTVVKSVCSELGVPVIDSGLLSLERLLQTIKNTTIAISGRHHINLILMKCGIPFASLPSNTWKIEATLEMTAYSGPFIESLDDLSHCVQRTVDEADNLRDAAINGFDASVLESNQLIERFRQWSC